MAIYHIHKHSISQLQHSLFQGKPAQEIKISNILTCTSTWANVICSQSCKCCVECFIFILMTQKLTFTGKEIKEHGQLSSHSKHIVNLCWHHVLNNQPSKFYWLHTCMSVKKSKEFWLTCNSVGIKTFLPHTSMHSLHEMERINK